MVKSLDSCVITSTHSHYQPRWILHSSHSTQCADICPQMQSQVSLLPVAILDIPTQVAVASPRMLLPVPPWAAGPIAGTCPEGSWQLSLSTDMGRVYWAAHPAEREKKRFKIFPIFNIWKNSDCSGVLVCPLWLTLQLSPALPLMFCP